jgi:hypothetical protein
VNWSSPPVTIWFFFLTKEQSSPLQTKKNNTRTLLNKSQQKLAKKRIEILTKPTWLDLLSSHVLFSVFLQKNWTPTTTRVSSFYKEKIGFKHAKKWRLLSSDFCNFCWILQVQLVSSIFFVFSFACKEFCALLSKIKWTCFFLFLLSFWEEPASSHVFFWSSLRSVSCCFGAVNYGKSRKKKKLKNILFKRCHTTCLSTASNAPRMPQFLFSLQVLHIHVMERIACLVKDVWCCPCIYWLAA